MDQKPNTSTLLRELEHNVLLRLRELQERLEPSMSRGFFQAGQIANSLDNWLEHRAPLLPGYEADWLPEHRECPGVNKESVFDMSQKQLAKRVRDGIRGSDDGIFVLFDSATERGKA